MTAQRNTTVPDFEKWDWCDICGGVEAVPPEDEGLVEERERCTCGVDDDDD